MRLPTIALLVAACRATGSPTPGVVAWQSPAEIAKGGGTKGPWQQNESNFDYVDDPTVALGPEPVVAWVDHRDKDVHVRVAGKSVNVSRTPDVFSWLPRVVVSEGNVYVLWQEIVFSPGGSHGGEILFARSRDGGTTFDAPVNLSNSIAGDGKGRIDAKRWHNGSLDLQLGPDGMLHAAWTDYDGPLWYATSRDGASFSKPAKVAGTRDKPARAPSLVIAGDGTTYLAWTYGENAAADVHVATKQGDAFGAPTPLAITKHYSDAPKLAVDRAGVLHVAYAESTGGPFDRARIHYTRSHDGAKSFEPAIVLGDGGFPALAVDNKRIVVIWELPTNVGLGIAIARDGKRFTKAETIPHSRGDGENGSHQGHLMNKLAVRGDSIAVVNSSLAPGKGSRVWLLRGKLSE